MTKVADLYNHLKRQQMIYNLPSTLFYEPDSWEEGEVIELVGQNPLASVSTPGSTPLPGGIGYIRLTGFKPLSELELTQPSYLRPFTKTERFTLESRSFSHIQPSEHLVFRQGPETRWIQNLRNSAYHLRQPIPIVMENDAGVVTATYDDLDLIGTGDDVKAAISDLCGKIVELYEAAQHCAEGADRLHNQEYAFLQQIIAEVQPKAWDEVQEAYRGKMKAFPFVDKGYINISASDFADVIIILSDESAERIEQLAEIDLEINLKFRPLYFFVEYESSEDYLDLDDYVQFY